MHGFASGAMYQLDRTSSGHFAQEGLCQLIDCISTVQLLCHPARKPVHVPSFALVSIPM